MRILSTHCYFILYPDLLDRYVRNRRGRRLQECAEQLEAKEVEIKSLEQELEQQRNQITAIGKEIAEEGAYIVRLRENERFRKLKKSLLENQEKIQSYDMEAAAKARRQFDEKYGPAKKRESELQAKVTFQVGIIRLLIPETLVCPFGWRDQFT